MKDMKIVILAHPRSGSSNLSRILGVHPKVNIIMEPFHEDFGDWYPNEERYCDSLTSVDSFNKAVDRVFLKYNGMKIQSYRFEHEMLLELVNRQDCKILFLLRKNYLKTVVSNMVADQNNIWSKSDLLKAGKDAFSNLKPLQISGIAGVGARIEALKKTEEKWDPIINQNESIMKITYEDLYTCEINSSLSYINGIFEFLGLDMPDKDKLIEFINPETQRQNDTSTYMKIPNIDEIRKRFESKENGFLI